MINAEFGLHELAIEPGLHERQRPKPGPLSPAACFLSACTVSLGAAPGELVARKIAVFITDHPLITVRKDTGPRSC
jgi:hypothetical protein